MNTKHLLSPDHDQLYQMAESQAGYFTASQAKVAGFGYALLSHHVRSGLFERVCPGIYRLKYFPASAYEHLFVAWLRVGTQAVISHDSALALYDLSDLLPDEIHLTIPRTTSRRHAHLRLHTKHLSPADVTHYAGLPVTTVTRTIIDVAVSGLREELVQQAIAEALRRGLTTVNQLRVGILQQGERVKKMIDGVISARRGV